MSPAPARLALLTGDRVDPTLELFTWLHPEKLAECQLDGLPDRRPTHLRSLPAQSEGPAVLLGSQWTRAATWAELSFNSPWSAARPPTG